MIFPAPDQRVYLVDIDGTVAHHDCPSGKDHMSRTYMARHRDKGRRGHHDYSHVLYDLPRPQIIKVVLALPYPPLFVTARPESCRVDTFRWLWWHIGKNANTVTGWYEFRADRKFLRMRRDNDHRKDSIVKAEICSQLEDDGFKVEAVFDDRQRVVDMWRSRGYTVFQVAPGNF